MCYRISDEISLEEEAEPSVNTSGHLYPPNTYFAHDIWYVQTMHDSTAWPSFGVCTT